MSWWNLYGIFDDDQEQPVKRLDSTSLEYQAALLESIQDGDKTKGDKTHKTKGDSDKTKCDKTMIDKTVTDKTMTDKTLCDDSRKRIRKLDTWTDFDLELKIAIDKSQITAAIEESLREDAEYNAASARAIRSSLNHTWDQVCFDYPELASRAKRSMDTLSNKRCEELQLALELNAKALQQSRLKRNDSLLASQKTKPRRADPAPDWKIAEHKDMVEKLFKNHSASLGLISESIFKFCNVFGLVAVDAGSTNIGVNGEKLYNQCFYLALAKSFLTGGVNSNAVSELDTKNLALLFKSYIEGAVLHAHPEWAGERVGGNIQAFSDFLPYALTEDHGVLSDVAVVVLDSISGLIEIYIGKNYRDDGSCDLLMIRHLPGHYQALLVEKNNQERLSISSIKRLADSLGLSVIETTDV